MPELMSPFLETRRNRAWTRSICWIKPSSLIQSSRWPIAELRTRRALYGIYDPTPERLALADAALSRALALEPDLPEVHLTYAHHSYRIDLDYERAREQLSIARRGLPNDAEAIALEAYIDRRQGQFEKAIQELKDAITRDPRNSTFVQNLAFTFSYTRQFRDAEQMFDRLIELRPDEPLLKTAKALFVTYRETGDDSAFWTAIAALPASMADDRAAINLQLMFALVDRDWVRTKEFITKMNGGDDEIDFAYAGARFQSTVIPSCSPGFKENQSAQMRASPERENS